MSRIGKKPINIPESVDVKIEGSQLTVKGPKGELNLDIHPMVKIEQKDGQLEVTIKNPEDKNEKALWGLFGSLVKNMIDGVTEGFEKKLEIVGIGYKAELKGDNLVLNVGYSHPVEFKIPQGITVAIDKNIITITGIDKQLVGEIAANIRKVRKPEPYKGKGIKYVDEIIIKKVGNAAGKGEE